MEDREFGTWKKLDEEESVTIGLRREDALFRSKLIVGVNQMAAGGDESGHPHLLGMLSIGLSLPPFSDCWVEVNLVTLTR